MRYRTDMAMMAQRLDDSKPKLTNSTAIQPDGTMRNMFWLLLLQHSASTESEHGTTQIQTRTSNSGTNVNMSRP